ncbi:Peroxisomal membrane protein PMP27 [Coemansia sp. RSA 2049]|nr:Peroxisomal membrane protein PMP27 [Coemansia sp. RSA 1939]KAJ2516190.1 Peroxisomal membrane protein PMP27 [Coemansia sp. RSA 2049]KAJ2611966.1 Peroxisomal membrane protein PMP27 [Coemansia sp. RSA 1804]KAJ2686127.1 Peroxisomal membrane protein PMP27 [Coemansia sp. RSA 1285]
MSALVHLAANTLSNSKAVALYVQYASTLVGRDKACRFGQYLARLLVYMLSRRLATRGKTPGAGIAWVAALSKTQAVLSTTRKVMRSGKFVDFARQFARILTGAAALQQREDEVVRTLGAVHKAGMCVFMLADTLGLAHSVLGLVRLRDAPRVARLGQRAWLAALAAQAAAALYQLHNLRLRQADLDRVRRHITKTAAGAGSSDLPASVGARECAAEERAVAAQRAAAGRTLLLSALDLTIPIKGLALVGVNEGLVALAGTVTSLMGIQDSLAKASAAVQ